ncbi:MAG: DASH family cryptochrome [Leptospira sp.]|nr:DASH family cryptochrome [Leptospira sp.]
MSVKCIDCNGLFREEDIEGRWNAMPQVFTEFRKKLEWNRDFPVRQDIKHTIPTKLYQMGWVNWELDSCIELESKFKDYVENRGSISLEIKAKISKGYLEFKGGEKEAWNRLQEYFWDKNLLRIYKETRNGMIGWDYSSKFSPWLANGCISPVTVYNEILRYEEERESNDSTYWMKFELLWREFFRWILRRHGKKVFNYSGIRRQTPNGLEQNWEKFELWRNGETGNDFVDANMRELLYIGFMSNRGRQNVASYLVHRLNVDWRLGAEWFESQLIDYDVSSNWGNWNYLAGVGNDPRNRIFNMEKQAQDYDPNEEYRKLWI